METRTIDALPEIPVDPEASRYGGAPARFDRATGFFRTLKNKDRWWLVDPDGHLFVHRGVATVRQIRASDAAKSLLRQFNSEQSWADAAGMQLHEYGFNGLGAWCDEDLLRPADNR